MTPRDPKNTAEDQVNGFVAPVWAYIKSFAMQLPDATEVPSDEAPPLGSYTRHTTHNPSRLNTN
jgi:hypothetical protein